MPLKNTTMDQLPKLWDLHQLQALQQLEGPLVYTVIPVDMSKHLISNLLIENGEKIALEKMEELAKADVIRNATISRSLQVLGVAAAITGSGFAGGSLYKSHYGAEVELLEGKVNFDDLTKRFNELEIKYEGLQGLQEQHLDKIKLLETQISFDDLNTRYKALEIENEGLREKSARKWWQLYS